MKRKRFLLIVGILIAALFSLGGYVYTYTTGLLIINIDEPQYDIVTVNTSTGQPDWSSITDNLSENTTCGEVPTGDLFDITPGAEYSGGAVATISLVNTANLVAAYNYLNMKVYIYGSEEAEETPNYRLLTLKNGQADFTRTEIVPTLGDWTQTSQADFQGGTLNQVDTATSPGDVILDKFTDNVDLPPKVVPATELELPVF